jgi:hypothetical protein
LRALRCAGLARDGIATAPKCAGVARSAKIRRIFLLSVHARPLIDATNHKAEAFDMPFLVFVTLAVTGWFYAAATYQNHGYAWADQTCESMQSFCAEPHKVGIVAIAVVTMFMILRVVKS